MNCRKGWGFPTPTEASVAFSFQIGITCPHAPCSMNEHQRARRSHYEFIGY
jgi:hypothetical protein